MRNDDNDSLSRDLIESAWLLDLARALVGAQRADDLVQEAWLERLRHPARAESPRALMATILRRLAGRRDREEGRRRQRETEALARRERLLDEASDRGRRLAMLWREIEDLDDEPRSLIVLRFLDGLEPQHIARKLGLSPNAARVRLHRALEDLRLRLDRRHGGRREEWLRALTPLVLALRPLGQVGAAASSSSFLTKAALLMTTQKKILLATLVLFLAGGAFVLLDRFRSDPPPSLPQAEERDLVTVLEVPEEPRRNAPPVGPADAEKPPEIDTAAIAAAAAEGVVGSLLRNLVSGPRLVAGRVVDQDRRPVAGAKVRWLLAHGGSTTTRSDASGRFFIQPGDGNAEGTTREGILEARDEAGRVASRRLEIDDHVRCDRSDVVLVLEPAAELELRVLAADGRPLRDARVEIRRPEEAAAVTTRSDERGIARAAVPGGDYEIVAATAHYAGRLATQLAGGDKRALDLRLEAQEGFVVEVLDDADQPIPEAEILLLRDPTAVGDGHVLRSNLPSCDQDGRCRLDEVGPLDGLAIAARASGHLASETRLVSELIEDGLVRIRLARREVLSWRLEDGEVARPADGETLVLRPVKEGLEEAGVEDLPLPADAFGAFPGLDLKARRARVAEGRLLVDVDVPEGAWIARTSRGEIARILVGPGPRDRGVLGFTRPRRLSVVLREGERPAPGQGVQIRDLGGDPLRPTARSDDQGRVAFDGLVAGRYEVYVGPAGSMRERALRLASVDLEAGSQDLELELAAILDATLEVRLGERPGLPARFELDLFEAQILEQREDPRAGRIDIRYRPLRDLPRRELRLEAEGWLEGRGEIAALPDARTSIALRRAAGLRARLRPPQDGQMSIALLRFDEQRRDWVEFESAGPGRNVGDERLVDFGILQPGSYRLLDRDSRLWSAEVRLVSGDEDRELLLDLTGVESLRGRVLVPAGIDLGEVRVGTEGAEVDGREVWRLFGLPVADDGSFTLRLRRAPDLVLVARHPRLLSTRVSGGELPEPGGELLIEMRAGARVTAELPEDIGATSRLHVFPAGSRDRRVAFIALLRAAGRLDCRSLAAGRYDFVFDCPPYAPLELDGVEVGTDDLDLGRLAFVGGQELLVKLKVPAGSRIPDLHVAAWRLDPVGSVRFTNARDENPVRLAGLAPGRYRIEIGDAAGGGDDRRYEIELRAGETPVLEYP